MLAFLCAAVFAAQEPIAERTTVLVLVDASSSMNRKDAGDLSRSELARRAATTLFRDLDVDLEFVLFSDRPRSVGPTLGNFETNGTATAIGDAVEKAFEEHGDRPISAVVILSDFAGNDGVDPEGVAARLQRKNVPIFTVLTGVPRPPRDAAVLEVDGPETAVANDEVVLGFGARGDGPVRVSGWLYRRAKGERELPQASEEFERLLARAEKIGEWIDPKPWETVRTRAKEEGDYLAIFRAGENQYRVHPLRVVEERIRVLYVEGRPRYEYRFLKNALLRDPKILCHVLLTSADADFAQEFTPGASDPAFRRPLQEFPKSREELNRYDVLILGDVDPSRVCGEEGWANIRSFVRDLGGGLALISGSDNPRLFLDKPALRALLPIEPDEAGMESSDSPCRYVLTPEGKGRDERSPHPIVLYRQLAGTPEKNVEHWEDRDERGDGQAGIRSLLRVKGLTPDAMVLVQAARGKGEEAPLFVTRHHGAGRVFWSGTDETWLWRYLVGDSPWFYPFWRNVLTWARQGKLSDGRGGRLELDRTRYGLGEKVEVFARGTDLPPTVTAHVDPPEGKRQSLELRQDPLRPGWYQGEFLPRQAGTYRIWTGDEDGTRDEVRISVEIRSREEADPDLNGVLAQRIADASHQIRRTRPQYFDQRNLEDLRKELESLAKSRVMRRPTAPIEVVGFSEGKRLVVRGDDLTVVARADASAKLILRVEGGVSGDVPLSARGTNRHIAVIPAVKSSFAFRIASDVAKTEVFSVQVADPPAVDQIRIWYSYPKSYKMEDTPPDRPISTGAIEAPEGTTVRIRVSCTEPLKEAWAVGPLRVSGKDAEGSFELRPGAGEYEIRLVAESGLESRGAARFPIRGISDQAPVVRFVDPEGEIEDVTEICRRPVVFEATDDFGPVEVALEWRIPGRSEWKRAATGRTRYELDLSSLDPQPGLGDRVEVRAVATDVGRRETSSTRSLIVRSLAHVERNVVESVERVDRTLAELARRQLAIRERTRRESPGEDEETKLRFRLLASDQADVADRLLRARIDLERAMNRGVFNGILNQAAAEPLDRSIREISVDTTREASKHLGARSPADAVKSQNEALEVIDRARQLLLPWCDDRGVILRVRDLEEMLGVVTKALEKDDDTSAKRGLDLMARRASQLDDAMARRKGDDTKRLSGAAQEVKKRIAAAREALEKGRRDAAWSECEEISRGLESLREK